MTVHCLGCSVRLVPREADVPAGAKPHHARGLCTACYMRNTRAGLLHRFPPLLIFPRGRPGHDADCAFCQDVQWLAETGSPAYEWPQRLGTTVNALGRRLYRHGQTPLANRVERIRAAQRRAARGAVA